MSVMEEISAGAKTLSIFPRRDPPPCIALFELRLGGLHSDWEKIGGDMKRAMETIWENRAKEKLNG